MSQAESLVRGESNPTRGGGVCEHLCLAKVLEERKNSFKVLGLVFKISHKNLNSLNQPKISTHKYHFLRPCYLSQLTVFLRGFALKII